MALAATSRSPLTGDNVFDVMSSGYKWDVGSSKVLNWSLSDGLQGEFWLDPVATTETFRFIFENISTFIDVRFSPLGYFSRPTDAFDFGSDLNLSLDGSGRFPSTVWAYAHFPSVTETDYRGAPGDAYLNILSQANALPSYAPGLGRLCPCIA